MKVKGAYHVTTTACPSVCVVEVGIAPSSACTCCTIVERLATYADGWDGGI